MSVFLPQDRLSESVPVLGTVNGGSQIISVSATAATNSTALSSSVVSIYSTEDAFFEQGDSNVTATSSSHFIASGERLDLSTLDPETGKLTKTHISVIRDSTDGTLYISERE